MFLILQMDQIIGKNHLFKRSIILIKAWCYYESRILGSHYSLLSSYALETLVLYIFHAYHASLDGPLSVLYRFLDFFGQFDWENYCIGLNGPVPLSSLPEITGELSLSLFVSLHPSRSLLLHSFILFARSDQ